MNWAFFLLRLVIGLSILSLFFFSQRFWHRAIWRATANFKNKFLRIAARVLWLALVTLVVVAIVDGFRMGHRHLIPRGTILPALVGLWFFSAVFAFVAVKIVRGLDHVWSWITRHAPTFHKPRPAAGLTGTRPLSAPAALVHDERIASPVAHEMVPDPSRRYFFSAVTAAAGATPFLGAMYGFAAERLNYQVRRVEIPIANLPAALDGMRIVQLSDIHLSGYMPRDQVRRAVNMANDLGADLAVVTGDFITGASDPLADCIDEIRHLHSPLGIWGCNGNHEIYAKAENAAQSLFAQAGMKLLRQENAQLNFKGANFNLMGVDYQRERTPNGQRQPTLTNVERLVRRDMPNILLSHNPNSFPRAAELGIELSLAGHTHGGQIQVEILDHRLSPARFITDYIAGLYQRPQFAPSTPAAQNASANSLAGNATSASPSPATVPAASIALSDAAAGVAGAAANAPASSSMDSTRREIARSSNHQAALYVNRGLGTVGAPVRLGVPPEISLLILRRG